MSEIGPTEFHQLKINAINCFKHRAFTEGEPHARAAYALDPRDPFLTYDFGMILVELGRADEGLDKLREAAVMSPQVIAAAAGQYMARRLRTAEGYPYENGWIAMLDIAVAGGLLPMYGLDALAAYNRDTPRSASDGPAIPRTIVQFWDKVDIPDEVLRLMERTKAANPEFHHQVFSDEAAREFLRAAFGAEGATLYDACPHVAAKADFFRAVYLLLHGGIYVDADEGCEQSLSAYCTTPDLVLSYSRGVPSCINNWFVATAPGLKLLSSVVENILGNLRNVVRNGAQTNVWVLTGPGLWTLSVMDLALDPLAARSGMPLARACFIDEPSYRSLFQSPEMDYKATAAGNWRLR